MMWRLLIGIFLVTVIVSALVSSALVHVRKDAGGLSLDHLRFFLDAYKAIGVAFLVALLAVVIPQMLPEARDQFERFKASREAYSQAKTSVIYLPEHLATLAAFPEAVAAVKDAHHNLHLAETYPKELRKHLHWHPYPRTWVDRNFWELFALRMVLDRHVDGWPTLSPGKRLQAFREALAGC